MVMSLELFTTGVPRDLRYRCPQSASQRVSHRLSNPLDKDTNAESAGVDKWLPMTSTCPNNTPFVNGLTFPKYLLPHPNKTVSIIFWCLENGVKSQ